MIMKEGQVLNTQRIVGWREWIELPDRRYLNRCFLVGL